MYSAVQQPKELMKTCTKCGETKPLSDFHKAGYGNYQSRCAPCRRKINAQDWHVKGYAKVRARRRKSKGYEWAV